MRYPITKLPKEFTDIKEYKPPIPTKIDKPDKPNDYVGSEPYLRKKPHFKDDLGCWFAAAVFIGGYISLMAKSSEVFFSLLLLSILVGLIFHYRNVINYKKDIKKHAELVKEYERKKILKEQEYINELKFYEEVSLKEYEKKCQEREENVAFISSTEFVNSEIKRLSKLYLSKVKEPQLFAESIYKGVSEEYFKDYLLQYFGDFILTRYCLHLNKYCLYPDFTFWDKTNKICVDIEIDEPYVASNGKPIHYKDSDLKRDKVFLSYGWFIIRFSEKQIVSNPIGCCKSISNFLNEIYYQIGKPFNFEKMKSLNNEIEVKTDVIPTLEQAHALAFNRYRNTYLSKSMLQKVNDEMPFQEMIPQYIANQESMSVVQIEKSKNIFDDDLPF